MRISRDGRGEIRLTDIHVSRMEEEARKQSDRDFLLIHLLARRGWRIGAIVGIRKKLKYSRWADNDKKTKERVEYLVNLPGIKPEDVFDDCVRVHLKGGYTRLDYLPQSTAEALKRYASTIPQGQRIFPMTERTANYTLVKYARLAGVPDADRIHSHRFRHYFATRWARRTGGDKFKVKSLLGHRSDDTVRVYVEDLTPEEEKELLNSAQ